MCAFTLYSTPARAAESVKVTVPAAVSVTGSACSLSEIAEIEGAPHLTERLGALLLSVDNGVITREQVVEALKVSGLEGVRVELRMPAVVTAESGAGAIDGLDTESAPQAGDGEDLTDIIKSLAAWDGGVEARYQGALPEGRLVAPASIVPGSSAATLKFRDSAGQERSLAVRLTWTQSALVLTRSVKRGEALKESDFTVRSIRVNRPGVYASRPSEVSGRSLRRNLSQGEPIALDLLVNVPIIERGKSVIILVRSAGLMVKANGEAMENGALGDEIRVRNIASKTVLTAVVVADDTVEVNIQ